MTVAHLLGNVWKDTFKYSVQMFGRTDNKTCSRYDLFRHIMKRNLSIWRNMNNICLCKLQMLSFGVKLRNQECL